MVEDGEGEGRFSVGEGRVALCGYAGLDRDFGGGGYAIGGAASYGLLLGEGGEGT